MTDNRAELMRVTDILFRAGYRAEADLQLTIDECVKKLRALATAMPESGEAVYQLRSKASGKWFEVSEDNYRDFAHEQSGYEYRTLYASPPAKPAADIPESLRHQGVGRDKRGAMGHLYGTSWDGKAYADASASAIEWQTRALAAEASLERMRVEMSPTHMGEPVLAKPADGDMRADPDYFPVHRHVIAEIETVGKQCLDGGTCHHSCKSVCFRRNGCVPLSIADSYLNDDWTLKAAPTAPALVSKAGRDAAKLHEHLLDMLGVKSHEEAGAEIGRLHALALAAPQPTGLVEK